jgi:hypothetical protein
MKLSNKQRVNLAICLLAALVLSGMAVSQSSLPPTPAFDGLDAYVQAQNTQPTPRHQAALEMVLLLLDTQQRTAFNYNQIVALSQKWGMNALLSELPEEQQTQVTTAISIIEGAWTPTATATSMPVIVANTATITTQPGN